MDKKIRLERILKPEDNRSLIGTFAHGLLRGPISGEAPVCELGEQAKQLGNAGLDAILLSPGMLRLHADTLLTEQRPGIIACLEWTNMFLEFPRAASTSEGRSVFIGSAEDAVALGADAVLTYVFLGLSDSAAEAEHVARNAELSRECERLGVVRIIETMIRGNEITMSDRIDADYIAASARIAAEIGCDLVKVEWPGSRENMEQVIAGCPVPVLVAGGDPVDSESFLAMVESALDAGAAGFVVGRNIVQSPSRAELVGRLRSLVHGVGAQAINRS